MDDDRAVEESVRRTSHAKGNPASEGTRGQVSAHDRRADSLAYDTYGCRVCTGAAQAAMDIDDRATHKVCARKAQDTSYPGIRTASEGASVQLGVPAVRGTMDLV